MTTWLEIFISLWDQRQNNLSQNIGNDQISILIMNAIQKTVYANLNVFGSRIERQILFGRADSHLINVIGLNLTNAQQFSRDTEHA